MAQRMVFHACKEIFVDRQGGPRNIENDTSQKEKNIPNTIKFIGKIGTETNKTIDFPRSTSRNDSDNFLMA